MRLLPKSLGGRLVLGMSLFTLVAVVVTIFAMTRVFERFVTGQIDQRLDNKLVALASQVRVAGDGRVSLEGDADGPPFDDPRHQAFWAVAGPVNRVQTRWLASADFMPPTPAEIAATPGPPRPPHEDGRPRAIPHARTLDSPGPGGGLVHMRAVVKNYGATPVVIVAAAPSKSIVDPTVEALLTVTYSVLAIGAACLLGGWSLVRFSLRPLAQLREDIADIRVGRITALPPDQPNEVRPLVDELNSLLAQNAANLARARKHVANLAHGLKTPIATLSLGVGRLDGEARDGLLPLVDSIERRVRHHLGRARSAALDGPVRVQSQFRLHLIDIVEALRKIYADKRIFFDLEAPLGLMIACEPQDVDEILGNVLDNAFKFAAKTVDCRARQDGTKIVIEIGDDGPGLRPEDIERVLRPGQRVDEQVPGFGFGLSITRELVELYAGELELVTRERGLLVRVTLPAVPERM